MKYKYIKKKIVKYYIAISLCLAYRQLLHLFQKDLDHILQVMEILSIILVIWFDYAREKN